MSELKSVRLLAGAPLILSINNSTASIKDTKKDLDEFVRPTEPTTQTTVALQGSDNGNNNTIIYDMV